MRKIILSTALAVLLPLAPVSAAVIMSENFDGVTANNYGTGQKVGNFFTVSRNDVDVFGKPGTYYCPDNKEVSFCLDLNGNNNGQITSNLFTLAANTTYTVSFGADGNGGRPYYPNPDSPYTFDVSFAGLTRSYAVAPGASDYKIYSFNVVTGTAPAASSLVFTSTSTNLPSYWGAILDDIKITAPDPTPTSGAVPEPASWAMMVGGFGLLGAAMRRRRAAGGVEMIA